MSRTKRHQRLGLIATVAVAALLAGVFTSPRASAAHSTPDRSKCKNASAAPSTNSVSPGKPWLAEAAFLNQTAGTDGWTLTAAGRSLAAGVEPSGFAARDAGRDAAPQQIIVATRPSAPSAVRTVQSARRTADYIRSVTLYCLAGETGNIDYEVLAGSAAFVKFHEHNISTGANRTRNTPEYPCPLGGGSCLIYAYDAVSSPWAVQSGDIFVTPFTAYVGLWYAYCG